MTTERNLRRTVLPNGLIVLTERMEYLHSVAMGVWIKSGSRCEPAETNGISPARRPSASTSSRLPITCPSPWMCWRTWC